MLRIELNASFDRPATILHDPFTIFHISYFTWFPMSRKEIKTGGKRTSQGQHLGSHRNTHRSKNWKGISQSQLQKEKLTLEGSYSSASWSISLLRTRSKALSWPAAASLAVLAKRRGVFWHLCITGAADALATITICWGSDINFHAALRAGPAALLKIIAAAAIGLDWIELNQHRWSQYCWLRVRWISCALQCVQREKGGCKKKKNRERTERGDRGLNPKPWLGFESLEASYAAWQELDN